MKMPRNYIIHAEPHHAVIAVACETCRSCAFYRSANGAAAAVNYHPKVCPDGAPFTVILLPAGNNTGRRGGGSPPA